MNFEVTYIRVFLCSGLVDLASSVQYKTLSFLKLKSQFSVNNLVPNVSGIDIQGAYAPVMKIRNILTEGNRLIEGPRP